MSRSAQRLFLAGPVGALECVIDEPESAARGVVVIGHPNPQAGGTLDNKVVQTLVRAFLHLGHRCVRLNFRGVGASEGEWDGGRGEVDDVLAVVAAQRDPALPLVLAGFSFGAYVVAQAAVRLTEGAGAAAERLVLIGPSTQRQPMPTVPADTLVVHGESDDVVPLSSVLDWARPQALPVVVVPGVGHFFHGQLTPLKQLVIRNWSSSSAHP